VLELIQQRVRSRKATGRNHVGVNRNPCKVV
jgi:hypothetical protein